MCASPGCMSVYHIYAFCALRSKKASDPQDTELRMVVSYPVGAGKETLVLCKSST